MSHAEPVNRLVFQMLQFYLHLVVFYMCTFSPPSLSLTFVLLSKPKTPAEKPTPSFPAQLCCGRRWWQQRARPLCSDSVLLLGDLLPTGSFGHACIRGGPQHLQRCTLGLQNGRPLCKSPGFGWGDAFSKRHWAGKEAKTVTKKHHAGATAHFRGPDGETQNDRRSGALCVDLSPSPHCTEWFCDCCTCLPLRLGRQDRFPFCWQGEGFFLEATQ